MGVEAKRGNLWGVRVYDQASRRMRYVKGYKNRRRTRPDAQALFEELTALAEEGRLVHDPRKPKPTALYRCFRADGSLVYVGIAGHALKRLHAHERQSDWWAEVATITLEHHGSRAEALVAEMAAIVRENPTHNAVGRAGLLCDRPLLPISVRLANAERVLAELAEEMADERKARFAKIVGDKPA